MCDAFAGGLVTDLMEGALDHLLRPAVHAHLRVCEVCASLLFRMRAVVGIVARSGLPRDAEIERDSVTVDACLPLLRALRTERRNR